MENYEKVIKNHEIGCNCPQSVLLALCEDYGLSEENALKISNPFGGGICRTGGLCGAVSGALMLIGLKYGMDKLGNIEAKDRCYAISKEFLNRFKDKFGALDCRDLLKRDISKEEVFNKAKEEGVFDNYCAPELMGGAVKIFEELAKEYS